MKNGKYIELFFENFTNRGNKISDTYEEWKDAVKNCSVLQLFNDKVENGEFDSFMKKLILDFSYTAEGSKLGVIGTIFRILLENNCRDAYDFLIEKGFRAEAPEYLVKYLKLADPRKTIKVGPKGGQFYNPSVVAGRQVNTCPSCGRTL